MTWTQGIDVSSCQGRIRWAEVPPEIRFAVVKVSEGSRGLDPTRDYNITGARDTGRLVGVYHFASPDAGDARAECRRLWDAMGDTMPDLPLVLDLESKGTLTGVAVIDWAEEWIDEALSLWAVRPILYTGAYFLDTVAPAAADRVDLARCPIWLAQYSRGYAPWTPIEGKDAPRVPAPWTRWDFWQFSGNIDADKRHLPGARIAGIDTDVDRNVFNGDEESLRALCGQPIGAAWSPDEGTERG